MHSQFSVERLDGNARRFSETTSPSAPTIPSHLASASFYGLLYKMNHRKLLQHWKQRFFVLDTTRHQLRYYDTMSDEVPRGCVDLQDVRAVRLVKNVVPHQKRVTDCGVFEVSITYIDQHFPHFRWVFPLMAPYVLQSYLFSVGHWYTYLSVRGWTCWKGRRVGWTHPEHYSVKSSVHVQSQQTGQTRQKSLVFYPPFSRIIPFLIRPSSPHWTRLASELQTNRVVWFCRVEWFFLWAWNPLWWAIRCRQKLSMIVCGRRTRQI